MLLMLALPALAAAATDEAALAALMQRLAAVPERHSSFTETQHSSLLDVPLVQSGTLHYRRPDYLERRVGARRAVIDGERVLLDDGHGGHRELGLDDLPLLRAFVASFRATLGGDLTALRRHYRIGFTQQGEDWRLRLVPRDPRMQALVESVTVEGRGDRPLRMTLIEANGDRTVTEFHRPRQGDD